MFQKRIPLSNNALNLNNTYIIYISLYVRATAQHSLETTIPVEICVLFMHSKCSKIIIFFKIDTSDTTGFFITKCYNISKWLDKII